MTRSCSSSISAGPRPGMSSIASSFTALVAGDEPIRSRLCSVVKVLP